MPRTRSHGLDRMGHPLSHTAAVVAGAAFIVLVGCLSVVVSDRGVLRRTGWWSWFAPAALLLLTCLIGYFRPRSRLIYVPQFLFGSVTLAFCVWYLWLINARSADPKFIYGWVRSLGLFGMWIAWVVRTAFELRDRHATP